MCFKKEERSVVNEVVREFGEKVAMPVRGFRWIGPFSKPHRKHFVDFLGWEGEIYMRDRGIVPLKDYYKIKLQDGYCIFINGVMIGPTFTSVHYNALHQEYLKRFMLQEVEQKNLDKPKNQVVVAGKEAVFQSAVELYRQGLLDDKMIQVRIRRYVIPEYQEKVWNEIKEGA